MTVIVQHDSLAVDHGLLVQRLHMVAEREGRAIDRLNVVLTGHATVYDLNVRYLQHDANTDVLAFPLGESDDGIDGEIYIDLDTADERHGEFGTSFQEEVTTYAIHGLLHLLGYTDKSEEGHRDMAAKQDLYLHASLQKQREDEEE